MNLFKTLIDKNLLNKKDVIDIECLRYCFGRVIQHRLSQAKDEWNSHRLRAQPRINAPTGIPNVLYNWPERYRAKYCQKMVHEDDVQRIKEKYCSLEPIFYNKDTQMLVETLVPNVCQPENTDEALNLYMQLKSVRSEAERIQQGRQ